MGLNTAGVAGFSGMRPAVPAVDTPPYGDTPPTMFIVDIAGIMPSPVAPTGAIGDRPAGVMTIGDKPPGAPPTDIIGDIALGPSVLRPSVDMPMGAMPFMLFMLTPFILTPFMPPFMPKAMLFMLRLFMPMAMPGATLAPPPMFMLAGRGIDGAIITDAPDDGGMGEFGA